MAGRRHARQEDDDATEDETDDDAGTTFYEDPPARHRNRIGGYDIALDKYIAEVAVKDAPLADLLRVMRSQEGKLSRADDDVYINVTVPVQRAQNQQYNAYMYVALMQLKLLSEGPETSVTSLGEAVIPTEENLGHVIQWNYATVIPPLIPAPIVGVTDEVVPFHATPVQYQWLRRFHQGGGADDYGIGPNDQLDVAHVNPVTAHQTPTLVQLASMLEEDDDLHGTVDAQGDDVDFHRVLPYRSDDGSYTKYTSIFPSVEDIVRQKKTPAGWALLAQNMVYMITDVLTPDGMNGPIQLLFPGTNNVGLQNLLYKTIPYRQSQQGVPAAPRAPLDAYGKIKALNELLGDKYNTSAMLVYDVDRNYAEYLKELSIPMTKELGYGYYLAPGADSSHPLLFGYYSGTFDKVDWPRRLRQFGQKIISENSNVSAKLMNDRWKLRLSILIRWFTDQIQRIHLASYWLSLLTLMKPALDAAGVEMPALSQRGLQGAMAETWRFMTGGTQMDALRLDLINDEVFAVLDYEIMGTTAASHYFPTGIHRREQRDLLYAAKYISALTDRLYSYLRKMPESPIETPYDNRKILITDSRMRAIAWRAERNATLDANKAAADQALREEAAAAAKEQAELDDTKRRWAAIDARPRAEASLERERQAHRSSRFAMQREFAMDRAKQREREQREKEDREKEKARISARLRQMQMEDEYE